MKDNVVFDVDPGLIVIDFTERHHVHSLPLGVSDLADAQAAVSCGANVIFRLSSGLPTREELRLSWRSLRRGSSVYFYWPDEEAIEVVTKERLFSFWKHCVFQGAYRRLSIWRQKGLAQASANPRSPYSGEKWHFVQKKENQYSVSGRGIYIRLDYWAKLTGGGSYGHTCYQVKALHKSCSEGVICITASEFALLKELDIHQIVVPPRTELADEFSLVENGKAYEKVIKELINLYQPCFVFERLVLGNQAVARACKHMGVPYIAEYNGSELTMSKLFGGREMNNSDVLQQIELDSFLQADIVSTVSDPVSEVVHTFGISSEKVLTNPNGVDLAAYGPLASAERSELRRSLGFKDDEVVLGFCGTFGGWHGIEVLANAIPKVCENRENARFLLIGDGGYKHLVEEQIDRYGLQERVIDLGFVSQKEAARYLGVCDILMSPHSKNMGDKPFFGSPTKLFEYMAYGVGIICADLVQLGEVMRPAILIQDRSEHRPSEARSVLVRPGSVEDLVAACLWLIDDEGLRLLIGKNAKEAAECYYSWNKHVETLWQFAKGDVLGGYHEDRKNL